MPFILTESGGHLLTENSGRVLLERSAALFASLEFTAPQFIADLAGTLPAGVSLKAILSVSSDKTFPAMMINAGICRSPTSGLLQAISGEIQAAQVPAITTLACANTDGSQLTIAGIYMGKAKFVYF